MFPGAKAKDLGLRVLDFEFPSLEFRGVRMGLA